MPIGVEVTAGESTVVLFGPTLILDDVAESRVTTGGRGLSLERDDAVGGVSLDLRAILVPDLEDGMLAWARFLVLMACSFLRSEWAGEKLSDFG